MVAVEKASAYVRTHGDAIEQARLASVLPPDPWSESGTGLAQFLLRYRHSLTLSNGDSGMGPNEFLTSYSRSDRVQTPSGTRGGKSHTGSSRREGELGLGPTSVGEAGPMMVPWLGV